MKNKIMILLFGISSLSLMLLPNNVNADVESKGLKEVVQEEINIFKSADGYEEQVKLLEDIDISKYKEDKDKVNVYFFRGDTCSHCFEALVFFAKMSNDFGKYYNLKSYEVWKNQENAELLEKVGQKKGDDVSGVPYIIVGDKSWSGYTSSYDEEIKKEIKAEYDKKAEERTDIVKDVLKNIDTKSSSNDIIALLLIILVCGGITAGIIYTRKQAS